MCDLLGGNPAIFLLALNNLLCYRPSPTAQGRGVFFAIQLDPEVKRLLA